MKSFLITIAIFAFSVCINAQNPAMEICPIQISSPTPIANVYSTKGKEVRLDSVVNSKPTVLIFYRGGWCPYCKRQLGAIQEIETEIKNLGYQIIVLSADHYSTAPKVVDKKELTYQIYSDFEQKAAKKYGISFVLGEKTYKKYKNAYQLDIEKWGQNDRHELPVPSVFIIKEKRIQYSYINPDYKTRLSPEVLLAVLHNIEDEKKPTSSTIQKAFPRDINSPEAIVNAGLNAISVNKGEVADWKRFESLFLPNAQVSVLRHKNDTATMLQFSIKEFIKTSSKYASENGFKEYSTGNKIEEYNGVATVFQSYVALHGETQVKGVNTYQLVYVEDRWWIASLIWTNNRNGIEVPSQYLQNNK